MSVARPCGSIGLRMAFRINPPRTYRSGSLLVLLSEMSPEGRTMRVPRSPAVSTQARTGFGREGLGNG